MTDEEKQAAAQKLAEKQALLETLRAKYGKIFVIEDEEFGLVVFRKPTKLEFRQLKSDRDDETRKPVSDEIFSKKVVVYPDTPGFEALLDEFPVLATNITNEAMKAGGGGKLEVKKL